MKQMQEEHIRSEAMFMEEVQMLKQQIRFLIFLFSRSYSHLIHLLFLFSKRNDEITLTNVH